METLNDSRSDLEKLLESKPLVTSTLMDKVNDYFQDEQHQKDYESWYEKKYGKPERKE